MIKSNLLPKLFHSSWFQVANTWSFHEGFCTVVLGTLMFGAVISHDPRGPYLGLGRELNVFGLAGAALLGSFQACAVYAPPVPDVQGEGEVQATAP